MFVKTGGHGCGKTTEMIKLCHEEGGYMVCFSTREARRVFKLAMKLGMPIPMPITAFDFSHQRYSKSGVGKLWFDNIGLILAMIAPVTIAGITCTVGE